MRSLGLEHDVQPESESEALSFSQSPAPRISCNLSSMVVKPSLSSGEGSDIDIGYTANDRIRDSPPRHFRRDSAQDPHRRDAPAPIRRRLVSPPLQRQGSPDSFRRPVNQHGLHRGGSVMGLHRRGSPPVFHARSQRLQIGPGYMQRLGSISPLHRPRVDVNYYGQDFGHIRGPRSGRGMRGRGGMFRDVSPRAFGGRGGRPYTRESNIAARAISTIEEEYVHRNDPNLSPREGDWICRNPSCGNLNFARRTYCNNCHKFRYAEPYGSSHSPRRGYISPPQHEFSQRSPVSPIDRGPQRNFNGFRSPPHGWDIDDDHSRSVIPPRRGGMPLDPIRREGLEFRKDNFRGRGRGRGRSNWHVSGDWESHSHDAFFSNSRGANHHPISPHDRWIRVTRVRSQSPIGGRLPRNSFVGRGRDDRGYDRPTYASNGTSCGRGFRRGVSQVRSPDVF